uniref:Malectin-like domain-containing protein n=1 Tax=Salix viminalis TaxID=40686 RepID=A0A6N2MJM1_SALVM
MITVNTVELVALYIVLRLASPNDSTGRFEALASIYFTSSNRTFSLTSVQNDTITFIIGGNANANVYMLTQMFLFPLDYWITPKRESDHKEKLPSPPSYDEHVGQRRSDRFNRTKMIDLYTMVHMDHRKNRVGMADSDEF